MWDSRPRLSAGRSPALATKTLVEKCPMSRFFCEQYGDPLYLISANCPRYPCVARNSYSSPFSVVCKISPTVLNFNP